MLFVSEKAFRVECCGVQAEDFFVEMQLSEGNEDFGTDAEILAADGNRLQDIADGRGRQREAEDFVIAGVEIGTAMEKGGEIIRRGRGVDRRTDLVAYLRVERGIMENVRENPEAESIDVTVDTAIPQGGQWNRTWSYQTSKKDHARSV